MTTDFYSEAEDNAYPKTETSGDTIRIPIDLSGRWFVRYFIKIDSQGEDKVNYSQMKHTATLVFQLPSPRKMPKSGSH